MNRSEFFLLLLVFIAVFVAGFSIGVANNPNCDCDPIVPDSQAVAYHLVGSITLEGDSLDRADFNGDGVVNGLDLVLTLRSEQ